MFIDNLPNKAISIEFNTKEDADFELDNKLKVNLVYIAIEDNFYTYSSS